MALKRRRGWMIQHSDAMIKHILQFDLETDSHPVVVRSPLNFNIVTHSHKMRSRKATDTCRQLIRLNGSIRNLSFI